MTMLFATHGSSAAFFACILLELALVITDLVVALLVAGLEFMTHFDILHLTFMVGWTRGITHASLVLRARATIFALVLLVSHLQCCHHKIAKEWAS
jgi:hypothetical protein